MAEQPQRHPKYRRSWLGRVVVLALVAQWAGLWVRSALWIDSIEYRGSNESTLIIVTSAGGHVLFWFAPKQIGGREGLQFRSVRLQPWQGWHFYDQYSFQEEEKAIHLNLVFATIRQVPSSLMGIDIYLVIPYWSLIVLTIFAYFAIGWFRRWRFMRKAHESCRP